MLNFSSIFYIDLRKFLFSVLGNSIIFTLWNDNTLVNYWCQLISWKTNWFSFVSVSSALNMKPSNIIIRVLEKDKHEVITVHHLWCPCLAWTLEWRNQSGCLSQSFAKIACCGKNQAQNYIFIYIHVNNHMSVCLSFSFLWTITRSKRFIYF